MIEITRTENRGNSSMPCRISGKKLRVWERFPERTPTTLEALLGGSRQGRVVFRKDWGAGRRRGSNAVKDPVAGCTWPAMALSPSVYCIRSCKMPRWRLTNDGEEANDVEMDTLPVRGKGWSRRCGRGGKERREDEMFDPCLVLHGRRFSQKRDLVNLFLSNGLMFHTC